MRGASWEEGQEALNPKPLDPKPINPKPLNHKLNPKP